MTLLKYSINQDHVQRTTLEIMVGKNLLLTHPHLDPIWGHDPRFENLCFKPILSEPANMCL